MLELGVALVVFCRELCTLAFSDGLRDRYATHLRAFGEDLILTGCFTFNSDSWLSEREGTSRTVHGLMSTARLSLSLWLVVGDALVLFQDLCNLLFYASNLGLPSAHGSHTTNLGLGLGVGLEPSLLGLQVTDGATDVVFAGRRGDGK